MIFQAALTILVLDQLNFHTNFLDLLQQIPLAEAGKRLKVHQYRDHCHGARATVKGTPAQQASIHICCRTQRNFRTLTPSTDEAFLCSLLRGRFNQSRHIGRENFFGGEQFPHCVDKGNTTAHGEWAIGPSLVARNCQKISNFSFFKKNFSTNLKNQKETKKLSKYTFSFHDDGVYFCHISVLRRVTTTTVRQRASTMRTTSSRSMDSRMRAA